MGAAAGRNDLLVSLRTATLAELARLETVVQPRGYVHVLGRVRWIQARTRGVRADLTESLDLYHSALAAFQQTRDVDSEAVIHAFMAESLHILGERRRAWRERAKGHALLTHVRNPRRRHAILDEAAVACLDERLPRSALRFQTAVLESALGWAQPAAVREALSRRAAIQHALSHDADAVADLRTSREWAARIRDEVLARANDADADAAEGEILISQQPEAASLALGRALTYFRSTVPARVPALHLLLARAQVARGFDEVAEDELLAGIETLEVQRTSLHGGALQVSFFDQASTLFEEMVRLQITRRRDPERALTFVERGRARQVVDSLVGAAIAPLDTEALSRELPDGLTLVYYVPLQDRLFSWAVSREGVHFVERSLPAAELSRAVAAHRAGLERRAPLEAVRVAAGRLYEELVRPLLPFLGSQRAIVFIPDGVLQGVTFAGLWDRQTGHYLAEDYLLGLAPSGTVFIRASAAAAAPRRRATGALIVGNPHFDRKLWAGLSSLPGAEAEAADIARLYADADLLTGDAATKTAFLQGIRGRAVVHYAGHAASSADAPSTARLLFAPDPRSGDSGALYLHELGRHSFPGTRVAVLAACRTAAGTTSRVEGALSLGRPLLAAGVPHVVGSLWDIDDSLGRRFFVAFHRALLEGGDPLLALRKAQLGFLADRNPLVAHPSSWASFVCMGGLHPNSLSKGELS